MLENLVNVIDNLTITTPIYLGNNEEPLQFFENVWVINENFSRSALNISIFLLTVTMVIVVNTMVLVWVKVKDKVLIDMMVTMDCVSNIMMVGLLLLAFPSRVWHNHFLCAGITFFRVFTATIDK